MHINMFCVFVRARIDIIHPGGDSMYLGWDSMYLGWDSNPSLESETHRTSQARIRILAWFVWDGVLSWNNPQKKGFTMRYRNRQRRPYRRFGYYFITTNVSENFALLGMFEFGFLLEHILHLSARLKGVKLVAYKINADHVHVLVQIGDSGTISEYVASWKRQFSRQANVLIRQRFIQSRDSNPDLVKINLFRWQPSYHSHLVTTKRDFKNHLNYIRNQMEHHDLQDNRHCFVESNHLFSLSIEQVKT